MAPEERKYDIVVFGASGVTGEYVVEELALHTKDIRWSIAGRNKEKLQSVLTNVGKYIGLFPLIFLEKNSQFFSLSEQI